MAGYGLLGADYNAGRPSFIANGTLCGRLGSRRAGNGRTGYRGQSNNNSAGAGAFPGFNRSTDHRCTRG